MDMIVHEFGDWTLTEIYFSFSCLISEFRGKGAIISWRKGKFENKKKTVQISGFSEGENELCMKAVLLP